MEEGEEKRKRKDGSRKWLWILIIVAVVLAGLLAYKAWHTSKCPDISCFNDKMAKCQRASYLNDADDATWLYTIKGRSGKIGCFVLSGRCDACNINVELLQAKNTTADIQPLEGLGMDCSLALGYTGIPNADLSKCHGALREEMQDLVIKKMHAYILSNIGKIGEEINQ